MSGVRTSAIPHGEVSVCDLYRVGLDHGFALPGFNLCSIAVAQKERFCRE